VNDVGPTKEALVAENDALRLRVAELEHAEAKLRAICAITKDIIYVMDSDGRYVELLPTQFPLAGADGRASVIGKKLTEGTPPDFAKRAIEKVNLALSTGGVFGQEISTPSPSGPLWWNSTVTRVTDTTVMWIARDITTEHRLLEAEAQRRHFQALAENT